VSQGDEEETCEDDHAPLPNIRVIAQQRNMSYTGSVLSTLCRQTIAAQDSQSPVLTSGSRPASVSVCSLPSVWWEPIFPVRSRGRSSNSFRNTHVHRYVITPVSKPLHCTKNNTSWKLRWRPVNMSVLMHLLDELCKLNNS
jgi:hypothetical protein